jgi:hypothetical protein
VSKHTPGRWVIFGPVSTGFSSEYYCVMNDDTAICQTSGDPEVKHPNNITKQYANARLIAAAPDLLNACQLVLDSCGYDAESILGNEARSAVIKAVKKAIEGDDGPK